jgi:branched-subunit amino acid ABC-type transport system permease component
MPRPSPSAAASQGLAGVALSQIDNVSPSLGTGYIIDSFMVWCSAAWDR